jgi:hypothetical protein
MRIQQAVSNFTANGQVGPWLKFDFYETPFDLGLLVAYGFGLAATIGIDYILDDMSQASQRQVSISQAANTITVTDNGPNINAGLGGGLGHCLAVGDAVNLTGSSGGTADGLYSVATVTSGTVYTVTSPTSQALATSLANVASGRVLQGAAAGGVDGVIKVAPVIARTSLNVTCPIWAARLHVTAFTAAGLAALVSMQGGVSS